MRTLTRLMVSLAVISTVTAGPAAAQSVWVGGMAGQVQSRQVRDGSPDSKDRSALMAGAFVEVQTPASLVRVLAEAAYVQRGGAFPSPSATAGADEVQVDYVTATVAPTLRAGLGPLALFAYGGPTVEFHVRTRFPSSAAAAYRDPSPQVFAVTAGGGAAVSLGAWEVRGEVRRVIGLSRAFSFDAGALRHRSTELLLRVAVPRRSSSASSPQGSSRQDPAG